MVFKEKVIPDETVREIAMLLALNVNNNQISKDLNIPYSSLRNIVNRPEILELSKQLKNSIVKSAKSEIEIGTARLAKKAVEVLESKLEEGDLDAVKVVLKIVGFNDQQVDSSGVGNLTVVLPGGEVNKVIEVKNE